MNTRQDDREHTERGPGAAGRDEAGKAAARRLDRAMVECGLAATRSQARALILSGRVRVDGRVVDKAGAPVTPAARIELTEPVLDYVGRGALKLVHALDRFGVDPSGRVAIDVGASTGGFTDVLLRRGAKRVYAVDVGYGQLAWRLRQDPRVVVMERTNARYLTAAAFDPQPDLAVIDVSFISVRKLMPALRSLLLPPRECVVLIKPQFEAGRERVGKGGLVKDPAVHEDVLVEVAQAAQAAGWRIAGMTVSPVRGAKGNIEFFQWWRDAGEEPSPQDDAASGEAVLGRDIAPRDEPALRALARAAVAEGRRLVQGESGG